MTCTRDKFTVGHLRKDITVTPFVAHLEEDTVSNTTLAFQVPEQPTHEVGSKIRTKPRHAYSGTLFPLGKKTLGLFESWRGGERGHGLSKFLFFFRAAQVPRKGSPTSFSEKDVEKILAPPAPGCRSAFAGALF